MANAADGDGGSAQRVTTAGRNDARKESAVRPLSVEVVLSGTGARTERTIWTEDHVQQNRRNQSDGSCRTPPPPTNSGGGGVTPAGSDDAMKRSAVRRRAVEALEFSPAPAPEQNTQSGQRPCPAEPAESVRQ